MDKIKLESTVKGTRILAGNTKRVVINKLVETCKTDGYEEISIPILQNVNTFKDKIGDENNHLMYFFKDSGGRDLCLAPEYTAVIMELAKTKYKHAFDEKVFYIQECFRGENTQLGRLRQFTQFGLEIINPTKDYSQLVRSVARHMIYTCIKDFGEGYLNMQRLEFTDKVKRGLNYYKEESGFEISYKGKNKSYQLAGGGEYDGGIGFAIGIDRIIELSKSLEV